MTILVDDIQQLADCRSHAERAAWLLTVPISTLSRYEMTIRNRLILAGFYLGAAYLDAELERMRSPRLVGRLGDNPHREGLDQVTEQAMRPEPDHELTEF